MIRRTDRQTDGRKDRKIEWRFNENRRQQDQRGQRQVRDQQQVDHHRRQGHDDHREQADQRDRHHQPAIRVDLLHPDGHRTHIDAVSHE